MYKRKRKNIQRRLGRGVEANNMREQGRDKTTRESEEIFRFGAEGGEVEGVQDRRGQMGTEGERRAFCHPKEHLTTKSCECRRS
jgi:hypothetical protein